MNPTGSCDRCKKVGVPTNGYWDRKNGDEYKGQFCAKCYENLDEDRNPWGLPATLDDDCGPWHENAVRALEDAIGELP